MRAETLSVTLYPQGQEVYLAHGRWLNIFQLNQWINEHFTLLIFIGNISLVKLTNFYNFNYISKKMTFQTVSPILSCWSHQTHLERPIVQLYFRQLNSLTSSKFTYLINTKHKILRKTYHIHTILLYFTLNFLKNQAMYPEIVSTYSSSYLNLASTWNRLVKASR